MLMGLGSHLILGESFETYREFRVTAILRSSWLDDGVVCLT